MSLKALACGAVVTIAVRSAEGLARAGQALRGDVTTVVADLTTPASLAARVDVVGEIDLLVVPASEVQDGWGARAYASTSARGAAA